MSKGLEKTFLQRKHISGKQVYEKMFDITINRVMQIKVQRGIFSQLMSIITKKKKTLKDSNVDEDVEKLELLHCWWKCKMVQPLWKTERSKT